jgi:murein DD-endopeptidase MepM/ murein hydrolase activator NlpD
MPVVSPVVGEVIDVVDSLPDNPIGSKDLGNPCGNRVIIKAAPDSFVILAHMQKGSIRVQIGDHVASRQVLGLCGNSGNSDAPHIHMHVQDQPTFNIGTGQNIIFQAINVELSGKRFTQVDWPLIRGLFVDQEEPVKVP